MDSNGRYCEICGHSPLRHYQWMGRHVLNTIKKWGYAGPGRDAMLVLRREVLGGLLLRRTKAGRASDLALPARLITIRDDLSLDAEEMDFYQALYTQSKVQFSAFQAVGTLTSNYAIIFDLLTRLRQAVDHPYLVLYGANAEASAAAASAAGDSPRGVCGICREAAEDPVVTRCRHTFCRACIADYVTGFGASSVLRDLTVDEAAIVGGGDIVEDDDGDAAAEDESDGDGDSDSGHVGRKRKQHSGGRSSKGPAAEPKRKKQTKVPSPAPANDAGASGGTAVPHCPSCLAPLSVDLDASADAAAAGMRGDEDGVHAGSADFALTAAHAAAAAAAPSSSRRTTILSRLPPERVGSGFRSSTKIEALLEELSAAQAETPGAKSLVFSQVSHCVSDGSAHTQPSTLHTDTHRHTRHTRPPYPVYVDARAHRTPPHCCRRALREVGRVHARARARPRHHGVQGGPWHLRFPDQPQGGWHGAQPHLRELRLPDGCGGSISEWGLQLLPLMPRRKQ